MNQNINKQIPIILGVISIITGFLGFLVEINLNAVESFYAVFAFFGGNGSLADIQTSTLLKISAITAPLSVTVLIIVLFFQNIKKWFFLTFQAKNHFVICGLGDMGSALANNLLSHDKLQREEHSKLLIIEPNESNPKIEEMRHRGAIVIVGDATNKAILEKAKIKNAKTVVCFTGKDITNLEIAVLIAEEKYTNPSLYLHLENRENYELLRNNIFSDMNIKSFCLYDSAAQTLFMKYPLGENVDTITSEARVKVALVGFDKVGESVLYRLLNLGHFYNQVPIEIDVFDEDIKSKEQDFLKSYPIQQEICKEYWNVNFKEEHEFYQHDILPYTQIIFCSADSQKSFQNSMRMMKTHTAEINQQNIQAYLFSDIHYNIGELISKSKDEFENLYTFGDFKELCTYDVIINESLDEMAISSNGGYNNLHGYNKENEDIETLWKKLNSFLKDSNRMQVEHLSIKLKVINHYLSQKNKQGEYEQLKQQARKKWFFNNDEFLWEQIPNAKELLEYMPLAVLDGLAQVEHNRWNAFHILNGWKLKTLNQAKKEHEDALARSTDVSKVKKDDFRKNNKTKEHTCIVKWEELDKVSEFLEHNYKSDDVESVIRIRDIEKLKFSI